MKIDFHPAALEELERTRSWYARQGQRLDVQFAEEVVHALATIADHPRVGAQGPRGTRRFVLSRFPYCLYYQVRSTQIVVMAVAHAKRRTSYWGERTREI